MQVTCFNATESDFQNFRTNWTNYRTLSEFQDISGHFLKFQEFQDRAQACAQLIQMYIAELLRLFPFQIYQTLVKNILLASVKLHLCSTNSEYDNYTSSKNIDLYIYFVCCQSLWKATCAEMHRKVWAWKTVRW